jgi:hypothetical protein
LKCSYKILARIVGVATVLTLTACGSGGGTSGKAAPSDATPAVGDSAAEGSPSPDPYPTEGPVTTADGQFIKYPDGFRIDFVSAKSYSSAEVERILPGSYDVETDNERDVAAGNVAVKVTLKYTNGTSRHLPLQEGQEMMNGFYGDNRLPADTISWAGDNVFNQDPMPTRIASGSSQLFWETFEVPKSELSTFVVEPTLLGDYTPYTFTEIAKVLK